MIIIFGTLVLNFFWYTFFFHFFKILIFQVVMQALASEKQDRVTIACLFMNFRGYRRVKGHMPPTKYACGGVQ